MFQRYAQNINPEAEPFLTFINQHLAKKNVRDPREIAYSQLYKYIKEGIQAYLQQMESTKESNRKSR
jgi:hypothetical protein